MTTIAYKDGKMASDSAYTLQGGLVKKATKVLRLKNGALIGGSGDNDWRDILPVLEKVKTERDLPLRSVLINMRIDLGIVMVLPNGEVYIITTREKYDDYDTEVGVIDIPSRIAAQGSGGDYALAAMKAGKSAYEAVGYAIDMDPNSRLPIHQLELIKPTKKRGKR